MGLTTAIQPLDMDLGKMHPVARTLLSWFLCFLSIIAIWIIFQIIFAIIYFDQLMLNDTGRLPISFYIKTFALAQTSSLLVLWAAWCLARCQGRRLIFTGLLQPSLFIAWFLYFQIAFYKNDIIFDWRFDAELPFLLLILHTSLGPVFIVLSRFLKNSKEQQTIV